MPKDVQQILLQVSRYFILNVSLPRQLHLAGSAGLGAA
jgi:hypothetical protein